MDSASFRAPGGSRSRTSSNIYQSTSAEMDMSPIPDEHIMQTNEDASLCKLDAVKLGYWQDTFLPMFVHTPLRREHERKAPDIYKGYYARVKCVERLVYNFIEAAIVDGGSSPSVQIVNLGAGYDTLYWRLKADNRINNRVSVKVVELDLLPVTMKKYHAITMRKELKSMLVGELRDGDIAKGELHTRGYDLIAVDMRDIFQIENKLVKGCNLSLSTPTLFIAECVLIYMNTESTQQLLTWIAKTFSTACFINYEQVKMDDHFGQIMYDSLKEQGCVLADAESCTSLKLHEQRFRRAGWLKATAADMNTMCASLPQNELDRIDRIAMIDEPEVLKQLFEHYCIVWAYKGAKGTSLERVPLL